MTKTYRVHTTPRHEINEGWVWIKATDLPSEGENRRSVVRINHGSKRVFCEAIHAADRDLEHFTGTFSPSVNLQEDNQLFISAWYRDKLGLEALGLTELTIETTSRTRVSLWWQFLACIHHPQMVVFLAAVLGVLGLGLGIVAVGLGLMALRAPAARFIGLVPLVVGIAVFVFGLVYPFNQRSA